MIGLFKIALKLLVNDKGKFFVLITGITFAVFLIMQMTSIFSGVLQKTAFNMINIGAKVWVMDLSVRYTQDNITMPSYVLDSVRSIKGVSYAVPLYMGSGLIKINNVYLKVNVIGLDDATLFGRPELIKGNIYDVYNNDAFIVVNDADYKQLESPDIGTTFEINDHRGVIVGIAKASVNGLFANPTLYTTYSRALQVLPNPRFTMSYVLIEPKNIKDIPYIKNEINRIGYKALTLEEFIKKNALFYIFKTGMGTNIVIMTIISFIVGLSIAGQTFYTFVIENIDKFGALKAIGAQKNDLIKILLFQSSIVGFIGYGFGILLSSTVIALAKWHIANFACVIAYDNIILSFVMVILIISFSSYLGIRRVLRIDPFDIFRS